MPKIFVVLSVVCFASQLCFVQQLQISTPVVRYFFLSGTASTSSMSKSTLSTKSLGLNRVLLKQTKCTKLVFVQTGVGMSIFSQICCIASTNWSSLAIAPTSHNKSLVIFSPQIVFAQILMLHLLLLLLPLYHTLCHFAIFLGRIVLLFFAFVLQWCGKHHPKEISP